MTDYQIRKLQETEAVAKILNAASSFEWELIENKDYELPEIKLKNSSAPIYARFGEYEKKYHFFLRYKLPYVSGDAETFVKKNLVAPQNVGVLSEKKIKAWIDYLVEVYKGVLNLSNTRSDAVAAFKKELATLGDVKSHSDYTTERGHVTKNGLEFTYSIDTASGYISKKIEVRYDTGNTIQSFKALSNNKYKTV